MSVLRWSMTKLLAQEQRGESESSDYQDMKEYVYLTEKRK
jgi:hypothetical protein